jgi:hypothetical protein
VLLLQLRLIKRLITITLQISTTMMSLASILTMEHSQTTVRKQSMLPFSITERSKRILMILTSAMLTLDRNLTQEEALQEDQSRSGMKSVAKKRENSRHAFKESSNGLHLHF